MHITTVSAENLKGRSFQHDLTPTTLIIGPNFAGKTSIIEAVRLALLGNIPELGKRNGDTFALASGARMAAALEFDNGGKIKRTLFMEKGSVKAELEAGVKGIGCETDKPQPPIPLLDAAAYFEMTESERIDYVFSKVKLPDDYTVSGVIAKLHRLSFGDKHSEAIEEAKTAVIADVQKALTSMPNLGDALTSVKDDLLAPAFTIANRRAKDTQGTVLVLTELKLREAECSAETLTDIRNDITRLEGLLAEANRDLGALQAQETAAAAQARRKRELEALLAAPEPQWQAPQLPPKPELIPVPGEPLPTLQAALDGWLESALLNPVIDIDAYHEIFRTAERDMECANRKLEGAEQLVGGITAELHDVTSKECCPFCKSKAKGWQKRIIDELSPRLATATTELDAAKNAVQLATEAYEMAKLSFNNATAMLQRTATIVAHKESLERQIEQRKINEELAEANHAHALLAAAAAANESVSKVEREKAAWKHDRQSYQAELERMKDVPSPTGDSGSQQVLISGYEMQRQAAKQRLQIAEALQQDLRRAAEAAKEHQIAAAKVAVLKAIGVSIKEQKAEMVATAFEKLLTVANKLCGNLLLSPLAYNVEKNEIGRWASTGWIGHKTMSGTEKALAYVAVAAALSQDAPFKLLILDELSRLTRSMQRGVLECFRMAVDDGLLDQVIGVIPMDDEDFLEVISLGDYSVIQMGSQPVAAV